MSGQAAVANIADKKQEYTFYFSKAAKCLITTYFASDPHTD